MKQETLNKLFDSIDKTLFTGGMYNLNIFGVRSKIISPDSFDDLICIATNTEDGWMTWAMPATTDPGGAVLGKDKMGNNKGTAILPSTNTSDNQYKFVLGKHQGKYKALQQGQEFELVRDNDKDGSLLSPFEIKSLIAKGNTYKGWQGINIHHASNVGVSKRVGNWSWGCQVVQSIFDWEKFLKIIERSVDIYGTKFTYTLFDEYILEDILDCDIKEFQTAMNSSVDIIEARQEPKDKIAYNTIPMRIYVIKDTGSTLTVVYEDGTESVLPKSATDYK